MSTKHTHWAQPFLDYRKSVWIVICTFKITMLIIGDIMGVAKGRYPYVMDNCCSARSTLVVGFYYLPRQQLADSPSTDSGSDRHRG